MNLASLPVATCCVCCTASDSESIDLMLVSRTEPAYEFFSGSDKIRDIQSIDPKFLWKSIPGVRIRPRGATILELRLPTQ